MSGPQAVNSNSGLAASCDSAISSRQTTPHSFIMDVVSKILLSKINYRAETIDNYKKKGYHYFIYF